MLTLIENGEIYAPDPFGVGAILLAGDKILKVGEIDRRAVRSLKVKLETIDAAGCLVTPGFIYPHQHILVESGEEGSISQRKQPEYRTER